MSINLLTEQELTIEAINNYRRENIILDITIGKVKAQQLMKAGIEWKMLQQAELKLVAGKNANLEMIDALEARLKEKEIIEK